MTECFVGEQRTKRLRREREPIETATDRGRYTRKIERAYNIDSNDRGSETTKRNRSAKSQQTKNI